MEAVLEFSSDLNEVVVIEVNFLGAFVPGPDIDLSIGQAEVVGSPAIEIALD